MMISDPVPLVIAGAWIIAATIIFGPLVDYGVRRGFWGGMRE